jgi:hypothetical protein
MPTGPKGPPQYGPNPGVYQNGGRFHQGIFRMRIVAFFSAALLAAWMVPATAQTGDQKAPDQKPGAGDLAKDQKKVDEFAEAIRVLGGPASNPECVWLGRRVVSLLSNDDLDTAFRHLDLYDRFGCPGGHIQAAFRCLVRGGPIDTKARELLNARVHACWISPTEAQAGQPAQAAQPSGTKSQ